MSPNLVDLIARTVEELRDSGEIELTEAPGEATPLFGEDGVLDSVGLVSLVVAVEQAIEDAYSQSVALADERAMSLKHSPYRTVATLAEYARGLLEEAGAEA